MPAKRTKSSSNEVRVHLGGNRSRASHPAAIHVMSENRKLRPATSTKSVPSTKTSVSGNEYVCAIERNQNGKYTVRVRAVFGQTGWSLPVYFLASSFNAAMKKLEESLQHLQKNEERLRFWGVERTDDPNLAGDLLQEFGLWLDRRKEFPRKVAELGVPRERPVPASLLAPVRRVLADSVAQERPSPALAGD
jgi:hypothetical protein